MIIIASRSTHKGYDNSVNTGRVKFRSRGCQTRTHDVRSTQHKFNCSFIHLLVWKNEWNCRKQKKVSLSVQVKVTVKCVCLQEEDFTFVQQSECRVKWSFSLSEEEQFAIYRQDFDVFMTVRKSQINIVYKTRRRKKLKLMGRRETN